MKYVVVYVDRYKLCKSEVKVVESDEEDITKFMKSHLSIDGEDGEELFKFWKEANIFWVSEDGDEASIDGEEFGHIIKKLI